MGHGCEEALEWLKPLENELADYQPFYVTKADILKRMGRFPQARDALTKAISMTSNIREKRFLENMLAHIGKH